MSPEAEETEQTVRRKSSGERRFSFNPVIERLHSFQKRLSLGLNPQDQEDEAAVAAAAVRMHERREKVRDELENLSLEQLAYILKDTEDRSMRKLVMEVVTPARVNPKNIRMFLKESQLQEFEEIFEYLDVDRSGDISHTELRQAFEDMEIDIDDKQFERMMIELDADSSGVVDFQEFSTLLLRLEMGLKVVEEADIKWRGGKRSLQRLIGKTISTMKARRSAFAPLFTPITNLVSSVWKSWEKSEMIAWIRIFYKTFKESFMPLVMVLFLLLITVVVSSSIVFYMEKDELSNSTAATFTSIPATFWYVMSTLSTVGYGDVTPKTTFGRIAGAVTAVVGILVLAVPISFISTNFQFEYSKHVKQRLIREQSGGELAEAMKRPKNCTAAEYNHQAQRALLTFIREISRDNHKKIFHDLKDYEDENMNFVFSELKSLSREYVGQCRTLDTKGDASFGQ